jgi:hypothetical protein
MSDTRICAWPKGCVALATREGLCAAHVRTCARCECPESWHPVVQMTDLGPELVCDAFVSATHTPTPAPTESEKSHGSC